MPPKKTPVNRSHETEYGLKFADFGQTRAVKKTADTTDVLRETMAKGREPIIRNSSKYHF